MIEKKEEIDNELREKRRILGRAKSDAARSGHYMDAVSFRNLEMRVAHLMKLSQELQRALGKTRNLTFPQVFMCVAEELLPEEQFNHLMQVALGRKENLQ